MRTILTPTLFVTLLSFGTLFLASCTAGFRGSIENPMSVQEPVEAPTPLAAR